MKINVVKRVYFSPTRTTKKILKAIAGSMDPDAVEDIDLTGPNARGEGHDADPGDLYIFGAPVYGGRLPALAIERFAQITGRGTPAVVVVLYGNRAYDDALLELRDLVLQNGFVPVAGAAFIGEHSFSSENAPIASGRPDSNDLETAQRFGAAVADKIRRLERTEEAAPLQVPGKYPYQTYVPPGGISPATNADLCAQCETCVEACPTGAVHLDEEIVTDAARCIICCACIKACPNGARAVAAPRIQKVAQWLHSNFRQRKEPELYL